MHFLNIFCLFYLNFQISVGLAHFLGALWTVLGSQWLLATQGQKDDAHGLKDNAHGQKHDNHGQKHDSHSRTKTQRPWIKIKIIMVKNYANKERDNGH